MPTVEPHPGAELLSDYALGRLADQEFEAVAGHVERCGDCQETLSRIPAADDTLIRGLSDEASTDPFEDEPELAAALAAIGDSAAKLDAAATQAMGDSTTDAFRAAPTLRSLRDYELLEPLGQGGMGLVYRARHTRLDRLVALKVLPAERTRQPEAIARFHREMKAVGNLDHPHIVRAYDAGEVDGKHFLVMELINGVDLATLAEREGPLQVADACELVRQAAEGLDYAHRNGLVHRDVKPSNLMLDRNGVVKVLDLGLARLLGESVETDSEGERAARDASTSNQTDDSRFAHFQRIGSELTGADQAMGTPDYMAPEQCSDSRQVDARSDVYSLGATLYRLLAGQAPFSGVRYDTLAKKIAGLTHDAPAPIVSHRRDLPAALVTLLDRMLAKQPADRPATLDEVARALAPFCRGHKLPRLAGGEETAPTSPPRRWRRLAAVLAGAAAVAAVGVMLTLRTPDGELIIVDVDDDVRDSVRVEVVNGDELHVLDREHGWSVSLDEGHWNVRLDDPQNRYELEANSVQILRGERQWVHIRRRAANAASPSAEQTPQSTAPRVDQDPPVPQRPPQQGQWRLALPAGFQRRVTVVALGDNRFELQTGGVLSGRYRWNGQRLIVERPEDSRYRGLEWAWNGHDLELVAEPPSGSAYIGARLTFASPNLQPPVIAPRSLAEYTALQNEPLAMGEDGVERDGAAWKFTAAETRTIRLFEIKDLGVENCILSYAADVKLAGVSGQAYLEMLCQMPDGKQSVSRGFHHAVGGTQDWATFETPLMLERGAVA